MFVKKCIRRVFSRLYAYGAPARLILARIYPGSQIPPNTNSSTNGDSLTFD